jgi:hypothetical protein
MQERARTKKRRQRIVLLVRAAKGKAFALRGDLAWPMTALYVGAQVVGAVVSVWAAHLMFGLPVWQISETMRSGPAQWFAGDPDPTLPRGAPVPVHETNPLLTQIKEPPR